MIADNNSFFKSFGFPVINDLGTVAFEASLKDPGGYGIYKREGGILKKIVDTNDQSIAFGAPAINNKGKVAFGGWDSYGDQQYIYTSSGGGAAPTIVADTSGPFQYLYSPFNPTTVAINDLGTVAFWAGLDSGGQGIFTGPDLLNNKVIATGDSLFGSTVTSVDFYREGLNDKGQIAFVADLANGAEVVARANPFTFIKPQVCQNIICVLNANGIQSSVTATDLNVLARQLTFSQQTDAFSTQVKDVPESNSNFALLVVIGSLGIILRKRQQHVV